MQAVTSYLLLHWPNLPVTAPRGEFRTAVGEWQRSGFTENGALHFNCQ